MKEIEARSTAESAAGRAGKSGKSQSLRLEKQTIRTLSGAELKLVGGGAELCIAGSARMCEIPSQRLF